MRRTLALTVIALVAILAPAAWGAITGTDGGDTLAGTAGDDAIYGRAGGDRIDGGGGNDTIDGGPGSDDIHGGPGQDAAIYPRVATGVSVTLDDVGTDGVPGENDNVHADVEDVFGGPGDDTLSGNDAANTLDGGAGNDTITGGKGTDGLYGGDGNDSIDALDGEVDTVDCGPGSDSVLADRSDVLAGCETRRALPLTTGTITHAETLTPTFTTFKSIVVDELTPANATVEVLCKGRGCPFRRASFDTAPVRLTPRFRGRRLMLGTTLEIRIVAPAHRGKVVRYTVRPSVLKRDKLCIDPGAAAATRC